MICFVEAVGVLAPGLAGWQQARAILAGETAYRFEKFAAPKLDILPPVERRRTGLPIKLAIAVGQDALLQAGQTAASLATVFASSDSDGEVIDEICKTLAGAERQISPTRFHNSVHNAPAGYWSIATGSHAPSTSLCALDWSVAAGLVEAASQIVADREDVLLIASDVPYPEPLLGARSVRHPFGSAFLLTHDCGNRSIAAFEINLKRRGRATRMQDPLLEEMRRDNSAGRALPLLAALAKPAQGQIAIVLEYIAGSALEISVTPC